MLSCSQTPPNLLSQQFETMSKSVTTFSSATDILLPWWDFNNEGSAWASKPVSECPPTSCPSSGYLNHKWRFSRLLVLNTKTILPFPKCTM